MSASGLVCFRKSLGKYTKAACFAKFHELVEDNRLPDDANSLFLAKKLKVGHIGTLDPNATGLVLAAFGEATKIIPYLKVDPKRYKGVVKFGIETDSADIVGKVIGQGPENWVRPEDEEMDNICSSFTGTISQKPPIYSAVHINGKRAYDLARENKITLEDMPTKLVDVFKLSYRFLSDDEMEIDVTCGSGTFIRSLARDLSVSMGTKGLLKSLDRVQMGNFCLDSGEDHKVYTLKELLDMISLPLYIPPRHDFGRSMLMDIVHGNRLSKTMSEFNNLRDGMYSIYYEHSELPKKVGNNEFSRPVALVTKNGPEWKYVRNFNYKEHW